MTVGWEDMLGLFVFFLYGSKASTFSPSGFGQPIVHCHPHVKHRPQLAARWPEVTSVAARCCPISPKGNTVKEGGGGSKSTSDK